MELNGKVAIVTGGTKGIGLATTLKLASQGYKVYACARNPKGFKEDNIVYHELDVTDTNSYNKLFNDIVEQEGRIDVLVANAGIVKDNLTVKMPEEDFDAVIDTNLKGVFNLVKNIGPYMQKQKSGSIIVVSSVVGEYGNIGQANYAASKAGLIGMSKSWAKEFSRKGEQVRVNVICPGYIETDMLKNVPEELLDKFKDLTMLKRLGKPEEITNIIAFLASDESSYITGAVIDANGGMRL